MRLLPTSLYIWSGNEDHGTSRTNRPWHVLACPKRDPACGRGVVVRAVVRKTGPQDAARQTPPPAHRRVPVARHTRDRSGAHPANLGLGRELPAYGRTGRPANQLLFCHGHLYDPWLWRHRPWPRRPHRRNLLLHRRPFGLWDQHGVPDRRSWPNHAGHLFRQGCLTGKRRGVRTFRHR